MKKLFTLFLIPLLLSPTLAFADYTITTYTLPLAGEFAFRGGVSGRVERYAQSFLTTSTDSLESVSWLAGANSGSPSGEVLVHIYEDNGGEPGTVSLGSQQQAWVPNGQNLFTFATPIEVEDATTYWAVFTRTVPEEGAFMFIGYDDPSGYAGGITSFCNFPCTSWTGQGATLDLALTFEFVTAEVPQVANALSALITTTNEGLETTTGLSPAGVVDWTGDNLISLFIGSGLALLLGLRYWILALMIISAIVFFSYRAWLFKNKTI